MTYDPIDTDADGVVEANTDNQSVTTEEGVINQAKIGEPAIAPSGRSRSEGRLQTIATGVTNKRIAIQASDLSWGDGDIYWPWIIRVDDILDDPLGKYYMYFSGDHNGLPVGMAYTDDLVDGPWTDFGSTVFTSGNPETPSVIWNEVQEQFHMFVHSGQRGTNVDQATYMATSTDGVNWTEQATVIDPSYGGFTHTGYFIPRRVGNGWIAYHLASGETCAISYSTDGSNWWTSPKRIGKSVFEVQGTSRQFDWNSLHPFSYNGERYTISTTRDRGTGNNNTNVKIVLTKLFGDRRVEVEPRVIIEPTETFEGTSQTPSIIGEQGELHIAYQAAPKTIALATLEGGAY